MCASHLVVLPELPSVLAPFTHDRQPINCSDKPESSGDGDLLHHTWLHTHSSTEEACDTAMAPSPHPAPSCTHWSSSHQFKKHLKRDQVGGVLARFSLV